jgi:hypothetical protein
MHHSDVLDFSPQGNLCSTPRAPRRIGVFFLGRGQRSRLGNRCPLPPAEAPWQHTGPIRTQLGWCRDAGVRDALFTHCGSEIVGGDERRLGAKLRVLARECGVRAPIAYDGLEIDIS